MCDKLFGKTCNVRSLEYIMQMYFSEIRHFKQTFNSDPCYGVLVNQCQNAHPQEAAQEVQE